MIRKNLIEKWKHLLGIGRMTAVLAGVMTVTGLGQKAYAAQIPNMKELLLTGGREGIRAEAVFEGYAAGTDYIIRLYINEYGENGIGNTQGSMELAATADGGGRGETDPVAVDDGIYVASAVIMIKNDPAQPAVYFTESVKYHVEKKDGLYIVTPYTGHESDNGCRTKEGERENEQQEITAAGCSHHFVCRTVREADPQEDAVEALQCAYCDIVLRYITVANSSYAAFLREAAALVQTAGANDTVIIETQRWISFNREVMEALEKRQDLTVTVKYRYQGNEYTLTVPPYTERMALVNKEGYCGFRYLEQAFS